MSHDIFISYSRRDTKRMQEVRDGLREAGLSVWTDEGIEPGTESWKKSLSDAIINCKTVVVLFSPDAANSTWVNRELDFAELHQKKLYPLLVRGEVKDAVPFGYTTFQFIDIRNDDNLQNGLQELVSILSKDFPHKNLTPKTHPQVMDATLSDDEAYSSRQNEQEEEKQQETLWKWLETDKLRVSVPHTWKVNDPSHDNTARAFLLHEKIDDMNHRLMQHIQDEKQFGKLFSPIPGTRTERYRTITDISTLEPLTGFIYIGILPFSMPMTSPVISTLGMRYFVQRFANYLQETQQNKLISESRMIFGGGKILALEFENQVDTRGRLRLYFCTPHFGKLVVALSFLTLATQMDNERSIYDLAAQSLHILPQKK